MQVSPVILWRSSFGYILSISKLFHYKLSCLVWIFSTCLHIFSLLYCDFLSVRLTLGGPAGLMSEVNVCLNVSVDLQQGRCTSYIIKCYFCYILHLQVFRDMFWRSPNWLFLACLWVGCMRMHTCVSRTCVVRGDLIITIFQKGMTYAIYLEWRCNRKMYLYRKLKCEANGDTVYEKSLHSTTALLDDVLKVIVALLFVMTVSWEIRQGQMHAFVHPLQAELFTSQCVYRLRCWFQIALNLFFEKN